MSKWEEVEKRFLINAKRLREAKGIKSSWIAEECGWSRQTQARFDKGLGRIRLSHAFMMSQVLGADPIVLCQFLTNKQIESLKVPVDMKSSVAWKLAQNYGQGEDDE
jgi:transcriptional regulator with XRE-family HTH domain